MFLFFFLGGGVVGTNIVKELPCARPCSYIYPIPIQVVFCGVRHHKRQAGALMFAFCQRHEHVILGFLRGGGCSLGTLEDS